MKLQMRIEETDHYYTYCILGVIGCAFFNCVLSYAVNQLGLPIYLDTIGTIFLSMLAGAYWGIATAVITNLFCCLYYADALYYAFIGVLIAVCAAWLVRSRKSKQKRHKRFGYIRLVFVMALISGILSMVFQSLLSGAPKFNDAVAAGAGFMFAKGTVPYYMTGIIMILAAEVADKGISVLLAVLCLRLFPDEFCEKMWNSGWKQTPLTEDEIISINENIDKRNNLKKSFSIMIVAAALSLAVILTWVNIRVSYDAAKDDGRKMVVNAASYAATLIDADHVNEYLEDAARIQDYQNEGYVRTNEMLKNVIHTFSDLKYLYVYQIRKDACYLVFDTDSEVQEKGAVSEKIAFDTDFLDYVPALLNGEKIDPIEVNSRYGYLITAYEPVYDSKGTCVAYVGADIAIPTIFEKVRHQLLVMILVFSGFFALILATGFFISGYRFAYPIGSLTKSIDGFMKEIDDQDVLDESVKKIKKLDIRTSDELEVLYHSVCEMAVGTSEQMRRIRKLAHKTEKMQMGLIITMADMVESRDSDTGAHVQKTAAYVRIILQGLKRKGYDTKKLTEKYMNDVEMSAPLHDVGKINVPDAVLNKPGKLTEEEFAVMKTHTTAGKKIIDNAISTVSGENYLKEARNMAAYHHERWDGKGYPEGLKGEEIPLSARVMAVADVFDALVSPRVYKPAFPLEKALQILREGSGSQFDPDCVEVFMDSLDEVKEVMKKYDHSESEVG